MAIETTCVVCMKTAATVAATTRVRPHSHWHEYESRYPCPVLVTVIMNLRIF